MHSRAQPRPVTKSSWAVCSYHEAREACKEKMIRGISSFLQVFRAASGGSGVSQNCLAPREKTR
jgi:hypothetical protein